MRAIDSFLDLILRTTKWVPGLSGRHLLVTIPVHLIAFTLLYFGAIRILEREILRTHSTDARWLVKEAVRDLHPLMESHDGWEIPKAVGDFAAAHSLLELQIYRLDGTLVSSDEGQNQDVADFLKRDEDESFHIDRGKGLVVLHGMVRFRSEGRCVECHQPAADLGVATMRLDLTSQLAGASHRLRSDLVILMLSWAILVGMVNLGLAALTKRSLSRIRFERASDSSLGTGRNGASGLILDPVSSEIFDSLQELLEHHRSSEVEARGRLDDAERMASLGQIAAGLAHEIKNPLAGIRGVIEVLGDDCHDEDQRVLFEQMVAELDRVNRTIHSLLGFARPTPPRKEPTDVASFLDDALRLVRLNLEQRNIRLEVEIAPEVGAFDMDPVHMRQVLDNLISNAADAIGESGKVVVRASVVPNGGNLILAVEDDGPGIAREHQEEIFEPFFTTKFSGTGLGLATVRSLMIRQGGRVGLRSERGRGTTFFVILPGTPKDDVASPSGARAKG